jgi:hypothetical protein
MANKVFDYYKDLPQWAKGIVVVGGIAIVYFTTKQIIKRVRGQAERKLDTQESDDAKKDLKDLEDKGVRPTLSSTQLESIINNLVQSMNDCGTDEQLIYNQFKKINNEADVYALLNKWQIRYYRPCSVSSPISYAKWLANDKAFGGSLSTWLSYDLSSSEIGKINKILSDKNIKFKF